MNSTFEAESFCDRGTHLQEVPYLDKLATLSTPTRNICELLPVLESAVSSSLLL